MKTITWATPALLVGFLSCTSEKIDLRNQPKLSEAEAEALDSGLSKEDTDQLMLTISAGLAQTEPTYSRARVVARSGSNISGDLWVYKARVFQHSAQGGQGYGGGNWVTGVRIAGSLQGLAPNKEHGFHIHGFGSCATADAASAGGHYNPSAAAHGVPGAAQQHKGDLGNLRADANGDLSVSQFLPNLTIAEVMNRSLIIHRDRDDGTTQPAGNAGPRHGCALIAPYPGRTPVQPAKEVSTEFTSQAAPAPQVKGKLMFADTPQGLYMWGEVSGLTPNASHGMHVHENAAKAKCMGEFAEVGPHFDPTTTKNHGDPNSTTPVHLGDLGNIKADANGVAKVAIVRQGLTIADVTSGVMGRAVIIHANQDDLKTQTPPGNSGARIGCGIIAEK